MRVYILLYEITHVRQSRRPQNKRWFTSPDMDLFVWARDGMPVHFQLYIDKLGAEKVLCWNIQQGFTSYHVNDGETQAGRYKQAPLLKTSFKQLNLRMIARNFLAACEHIDTGISDFVYARLMEIPTRQAYDDTDRRDLHLPR